ncbi:MAG: HNH endonuclease [Candidatus Aureabacteria bacterium]|jgi:5-methylcytosine-specific restriction endonuclease McrA|nr:HNH endonuclease [Candidatus Auribacterota bacterium]NLW94687.1 HNH endonuclease [Chlamydiota bacterium]HOE26882.1 HNH endonuclease [bacterium]HQM53153.1 HNH endonuclease [bacterium]
MKRDEPKLSRSVLVLNRLWQPVHVCGMRRAFSLVYRGAAQVIYRENGSFAVCDFPRWAAMRWNDDRCAEYVATVTMKIRLPEIIILRAYERLPAREVKLTRRNIYLRDCNICQYCGRPFREQDLNLDHVVPRRLGGATTWTNLVCSCVECNLKKGEKTLESSGMGLLRQPKKPRWSPFNQIAFRRGVCASWEQFLDPAAWNVQILGGAG